MNFQVLTPKSTIATGEASGIRERLPSETIHLSDGSFCHACLCEGPFVWTDHKHFWETHSFRCS
jgi:hypothetical protein